jgi:hypothetical protein
VSRRHTTSRLNFFCVIREHPFNPTHYLSYAATHPAISLWKKTHFQAHARHLMKTLRIETKLFHFFIALL